MKYRVEFTPENYCYSGEWYTELVEADSEGEAMELVGCHLIDNGESIETVKELVFRVRKYEE